MRLLTHSTILVCALLISCDVEKKAISKAESAFEYYSDGKKEKAAKTFLKLTEKFPSSNYYGKNLFNAAYIYEEIDSLDKAVSLYKRILNADLNDSEKDSTRNIWHTRANYKHWSSRNIGKIYLRQNYYRDALTYLIKSRYDYPYISDSTQSIKRQEIEVDRLIANCYVGLNKPDSALIITLAHALVESPWNRHPAKERALILINEHFNPKDVLTELMNGFKNIMAYPTFVSVPFMDKQIIVVPYLTPANQLDESHFKSTSLFVDLYRQVYP